MVSRPELERAVKTDRSLDVVVVFGAGRMGSQIGCEYALAGHEVVWVARSPKRARKGIEEAFRLANESGLFSASVTRRALDEIVIAGDTSEVADPVRLVVESIEEQFERKVQLLAPVARAWPTAVIASNTSSIPITALGDAIGAPERMIGVHYWNPPLLMPVVEVVRGAETDDPVVAQMLSTLRGMAKRPVVVEREVPGFIWNRLQFALLREAIWLVETGVASPETVDEVVRSSLARRWRLTGPFETVALGGAKTFSDIATNLFPELSTATDLTGLDRWTIKDQSVLAALRDRRDRALAAELLTERTEGIS